MGLFLLGAFPLGSFYKLCPAIHYICPQGQDAVPVRANKNFRLIRESIESKTGCQMAARFYSYALLIASARSEP